MFKASGYQSSQWWNKLALSRNWMIEQVTDNETLETDECEHKEKEVMMKVTYLEN